MPGATSLDFSRIARSLAAEARRQGLNAPVFRSPPRRPGATRTLRRRPDGAVVVAVRLRGRAVEAVLADLVEGVLAANGVTGAEADPLRVALVAAARAAGADQAA